VQHRIENRVEKKAKGLIMIMTSKAMMKKRRCRPGRNVLEVLERVSVSHKFSSFWTVNR